MNAVVVSVQRGQGPAAAVHEADVEALAARLRDRVAECRLGEYDGCDTFSSESRLYLFSHDADRLAAAVMEIVATLPWRERVHVRVSLDPLGAAWRRVDA